MRTEEEFVVRKAWGEIGGGQRNQRRHYLKRVRTETRVEEVDFWAGSAAEASGYNWTT